MKRNLFVLLILFSFVAIISGQHRIGFYAGGSTNKLSGDKIQYSIYKSGPGFSTGVILDLQIFDDVFVSINPGYRFSSTKYLAADTITLLFKKKLEYRDSLDIRLNILNLPIFFKVLSDNHHFHVSSGIELIYLLNTKAIYKDSRATINEDSKKFNLAANFGLGYNIPVKESNVSIELIYSQALNNWSRKDPEESYIPRVKSSGLRLLLSWQIPLKNNKKQKP